ncbi:barttin [Pelobates fuscus]|uniref:barttin n=1 Tax=Pelobates fuscus TaxID=191477 RepID=UPI002FE4F7A2
MAEDKTFRYGLIVLGFFLVMIGMFIMSVDKPHVYITFCTMGVFMVCIGITWSICQCYPKITFTPVDMEAAALTEKSSGYPYNEKPEKPWSTTHYTTSKEAERFETSLPSYEQIEKKVEGPAEPKGDLSIPSFMQTTLSTGSKSKLQAMVEIHENLIDVTGIPNGIEDIECQSDDRKAAPLALVEGDTSSSSDDSSSSDSSLKSCDAVQNDETKNDIKELLGSPYSGEGLTLIDASAPTYERIGPSLEQVRALGPNWVLGADGEEEFVQALFLPEHTQEPEIDEMYYRLEDEPDNILIAGESDLEQ